MAACQPGQSHASLPEVQAAGEAAEVPDMPFSAQPSTVGDARALLGSYQKVFGVSTFLCLTPPMQLLMVLLLLKSDFSMVHVSWSTHRPLSDTWELHVLFKHRLATRVVQSYAGPGAAQGKESEDPLMTPGLQEGPRVTWQGLQPCPSLRLRGSSRAGKLKEKMTIRQLCCVPGSALQSPPGTGERHFPAFQGFGVFFLQNHRHGSGKARATGSWFFGFVRETDLELSFPRI